MGAFAAANGCALAMMSVSVTMKMKSTDAETKKILNEVLDGFIILRDELKECYINDAKAYEEYLSAKKLPAASKERTEYLKEALAACAKVPLDTALKAVKTLQMTDEVEPRISPVIKSDVICARIMLKAAIACSVENIKANLPFIKDEALIKELEENIRFLQTFCNPAL